MSGPKRKKAGKNKRVQHRIGSPDASVQHLGRYVAAGSLLGIAVAASSIWMLIPWMRGDVVNQVAASDKQPRASIDRKPDQSIVKELSPKPANDKPVVADHPVDKQRFERRPTETPSVEESTSVAGRLPQKDEQKEPRRIGISRLPRRGRSFSMRKESDESRPNAFTPIFGGLMRKDTEKQSDSDESLESEVPSSEPEEADNQQPSILPTTLKDRILDLPDPSSNSTSKQLVKFDSLADSDIALTLLNPESSKTKFQLQAVESEATSNARSWSVVRAVAAAEGAQTDSPGAAVATFTLQDGILSFHWSEDKQLSSQAADILQGDSLRLCLLEFGVGDHQVRCFLHRPSTVPKDWNSRFALDGNDSEFVHYALPSGIPNRDDIHFDVWIEELNKDSPVAGLALNKEETGTVTLHEDHHKLEIITTAKVVRASGLSPTNRYDLQVRSAIKTPTVRTKSSRSSKSKRSLVVVYGDEKIPLSINHLKKELKTTASIAKRVEDKQKALEKEESADPLESFNSGLGLGDTSLAQRTRIRRSTRSSTRDQDSSRSKRSKSLNGLLEDPSEESSDPPDDSRNIEEVKDFLEVALRKFEGLEKKTRVGFTAYVRNQGERVELMSTNTADKRK